MTKFISSVFAVSEVQGCFWQECSCGLWVPWWHPQLPSLACLPCAQLGSLLGWGRGLHRHQPPMSWPGWYPSEFWAILVMAAVVFSSTSPLAAAASTTTPTGTWQKERHFVIALQHALLPMQEGEGQGSNCCVWGSGRRQCSRAAAVRATHPLVWLAECVLPVRRPGLCVVPAVAIMSTGTAGL